MISTKVRVSFELTLVFISMLMIARSIFVYDGFVAIFGILLSGLCLGMSIHSLLNTFEDVCVEYVPYDEKENDDEKV